MTAPARHGADPGGRAVPVGVPGLQLAGRPALQARQIDCFRNVARVLALDYQIKAINPELSAFAGAALTCYASPDDSLAILAAFEIAQPGDVIVAATEAFKGSAVVGDLFAAMAVSAAVSAIVTDGLARDCDGIIATGLPVFASGISPNSAAQSGPGTVGLPVVISGVRTAPGDVVAGDRDGVVVVAQDHLDDVHGQLLAVRAAESSYPKDPGGQVHVPEYVRHLLASEQVATSADGISRDLVQHASYAASCDGERVDRYLDMQYYRRAGWGASRPGHPGWLLSS